MSGITHYRSVFEPRTYLANAKIIWDIAKWGGINDVRVYDNFPYFLGGRNVAGVEQPFLWCQSLERLIRPGTFGQIVKEFTSWPSYEIEFARLHFNDRFKYQGFWHRDAARADKNNSIVALFYFLDETGFRIMPEGTIESETNIGDELQTTKSYAELPHQWVLDARAGDVLLMKSYLLHRGYNNKRRAHLHVRLRRAETFSIREWKTEPYEDKSSRWDRVKNLVRYCLPGEGRSSWWQK